MARTDRRTGVDRRTQVDRRTRTDAGAIGNERRAGVDRRSGIDRRQNRGIEPYTRLRLAMAIGVVLSIPAFNTWSDGGMAIDKLAIRVAVAMAFALIAVNGINALIVMYQPKPVQPEAQLDSIEDAVEIDAEER